MSQYHPGQFVKMKWWVGQICDVASSGQAIELESVYYLASKTISRQWIALKRAGGLTELPPDDAIQYSEHHDLCTLTDLLMDFDDLEHQWTHASPTTSDVPEVGQFVKVCEWCGRIRDMGQAHDRTFLVVESPKLLSRASGAYEVLEVKPKQHYRQIHVISREDALADIQRFRQAVQARIHKAEEILTRWKHGD